MYRNVYFHKVVRAGEGMVKLALQRARRLAVQGRLTWRGVENPVYKLLLGLQLETREFTDLDDISVTHCFKLRAHGDEPTLAKLCNGLLYRRLFKTIDLSHIEDPQRISTMLQAVGQAIAAAGGDAGYDLFYDEPSDRPYETVPPGAGDGPTGILVVNFAGESQDFAAISPLVGALNRQLWFRRLHVAAEWRALAQQTIAAM
jgi:HD superfamily phosphohydrolase